jgi:hypothetical protein
MFGLFKRKLNFVDKTERLVNYTFPKAIVSSFNDKFPGKFDEAEKGLKLFFFLILWNEEANFSDMIEMYNKNANELWNIFLSDAKEYADFCDHVFGHFIHYTSYDTEKELEEYFIKASREVLIALDKIQRSDNDSHLYMITCLDLDTKIKPSGPIMSSETDDSQTDTRYSENALVYLSSVLYI